MQLKIENITLLYSKEFDEEYDPDGEDQSEVEGHVSAHLFDEYKMYTLVGHITWIISLVIETFLCEDNDYSPIEILRLVEMLEKYLTPWQKSLVDQERPGEEEANQAARDTVLIALSVLEPSWVTIVQDTPSSLDDKKEGGTNATGNL